MSLDHDGSSDVDSTFELLDPSVQEAPTEVDDSSGDLTSTEDDEIDDEVVVDMDVASGTSGDPRFVRLHRTWWNGTSGVIDLRPFGPLGDCDRGQRLQILHLHHRSHRWICWRTWSERVQNCLGA